MWVWFAKAKIRRKTLKRSFANWEVKAWKWVRKEKNQETNLRDGNIKQRKRDGKSQAENWQRTWWIWIRSQREIFKGNLSSTDKVRGKKRIIVYERRRT